MNVNIETVHFTADAKLIDHVNKKVQKLSTFQTGLSGPMSF